MTNKQTGTIGEALAYKYLKKNKYKILETNYACKLGEIDIIAFKNDYIVFVEVKHRLSLQFGSPAEAVNVFKQQHIKNTASYWLMKNPKLNYQVRFDVIEVLDGVVTSQIENAF